LLSRLAVHSKSVFKLDLDKVRQSPRGYSTKNDQFEAAAALLESIELILSIGYPKTKSDVTSTCSSVGLPVFSSTVMKFGVDIITGCIQLGFGRMNDNSMFSTKEIGLKARSILLDFIDSKYLFSSLFSDLVQVLFY